MRKKYLYLCFLTLVLSAVIRFGVFAIQEPDKGLYLLTPQSCPSSGCAAGQRLNFTVNFSIEPQFTGGPNTQVCIYTLIDGIQGEGIEPWGDFSQGWITENATYSAGQVNTLCRDAALAGDEFLTGAYATHPEPTQDQIKFALNILPKADRKGHVRAIIFQLDSTGTNWVETTNPADAFFQFIPVAPLNQTAYTAELPSDCSALKPCYVHSGDDKPGGQGTGLYDAIQALKAGGEIFILKDYRIKTYPLTVDKNLTIKGYDAESMLTSINSNQACGNSLIQYHSGGVLRGLKINDGNCNASSSRTLVEIDSSEQVTIQNSTLTSGDVAIQIHDNTGAVDIAFNEITNNLDYAVLVDPGTSSPGRVKIYANNLLKNGVSVQVNCNSGGIVDHNFWGEGELASGNTTDCVSSTGKELGAPILVASDGRGVRALLSTVRDTFAYHFDGKIGLRHTSGGDFNVVIVNHGQGKIENIPFYETGSGEVVPCGNFYDIFLAADADPKNLEIAFKYDLNDQCINIIESDYYCGNANQARYPLWWYDPVTDTTAGWDRTGQTPEGTGSGGESGQVTTCYLQRDEIIVKIDNSGRPGLFSDLSFIPFVTGYIDGAPLTDFSAVFTNFYTRVTWTTSREKNIKRYELLRSNQQTSGYELITTVNVAGDSTSPNTYQYFDYDVDLSTTYYYKLQVFHRSEADEIIGRHGPLTLNVPAPTVTNTPTVTRTRIPTSTPVYKTPTRPIYRSPTPGGTPTQVRTYGPSPTGGTKPPFEPSPTGTITPPSDSGYPAGDTGTPTQTALPESEAQTLTLTGTTGENQRTATQPPTDGMENGHETDQGDDGEPIRPAPRWGHLIIGLVSGLALLIAASLIMAKLIF